MSYIFIAAGIALILGIIIILFDYSKKKKSADTEKEKYIPTPQDQIPIDYIRSGIMKLKNGGYRVIVEIPSVNIDLMESGEQSIVHGQYRQILNGIEFPFQILQQSRTVDIADYRKLLEKKMSETKNRLNQRLIGEFDVFLGQLIKERTILTKKFYVVIPYNEDREVKTIYATKEEKNKKKDKKNKKKKAKEIDAEAQSKKDILEEEKRFDKARKQLYMRANAVERVFRNFDIAPSMLNDSEISELFYASYNKERSVYQPLAGKDPSDYSTLRVKAGRRVNR